MKLLFVDHACHLRTGSADFFLEILRKSFTVDTHYYEETYKTGLTDELCEPYDVIVYWEFLPSRRKLIYANKPTVFVPMYDNEWGSYFQWRRIARSGMSVISFCKAITRHARRCGVRNLLELQYFPDPAQFENMAGDVRHLLLWERGQVNFGIIKKLFRPEDFDRVTICRRKEEAVKSAAVSDEDQRVWNVTVVETGFVSKEEYYNQIRSAGVVIAPRLKEGIGMAFLEAMAMGKIVVANNDATMNEYIEDGKTGFLFDAMKPHRISLANAESVVANVKKSAVEYFAAWSRRLEKINDFIKNVPAPKDVVRRIDCFYWLFLIEGVIYRMQEQFFLKHGKDKS